MNFYFLDVVDAGVSGGSFDQTVILILLVTILIEAAIMMLMKYNRFGKSLLHSFIVNVASIAAGFVMANLAIDLFDSNIISNFLILFVITAIIEFAILYLINRKLPVIKTLQVTVVMNMVTYLLFYFFQLALW